MLNRAEKKHAEKKSSYWMSLSVSKYKLAELSAAAGLAYGKPHSALLPMSSPLNEVYLISAPIPITAGYVYQ